MVIKNISPQRDLAKLKTNIPRSLASAIPDPILYEHGLVGECNDLIFGFTLADYATAKGLSEGDIPKILRICMEEIEKRGLETEGIYRVYPLLCIMLLWSDRFLEGLWTPCHCADGMPLFDRRGSLPANSSFSFNMSWKGTKSRSHFHQSTISTLLLRCSRSVSLTIFGIGFDVMLSCT